MKYSESMVKKTMNAINNHPEHSFWNVHKRAQCNDLGFCEIRFENVDGIQMAINICGNEVNAVVYTDKNCSGYKWLGSCYLAQITNDSYMMWLGIKLSKMYDYAENCVECA